MHPHPRGWWGRRLACPVPGSGDARSRKAALGRCTDHLGPHKSCGDDATAHAAYFAAKVVVFVRRVLGGIVLGLLLVYPGTEFVRFLFTNLTRVYPDVTLTDCLLILLILLVSIQLLLRVGPERPREPDLRMVSRQPRQPRPAHEPQQRREPHEPRPARAERPPSPPREWPSRPTARSSSTAEAPARSRRPRPTSRRPNSR